MSSSQTANPLFSKFRKSAGILLVVGFVVGVWFSILSRSEKSFVKSEQYRLDPKRFHLPDRPPWIPRAFVQDVLLAAGLDETESVLDPGLPEKLAAAFDASPWVVRVNRVQVKYPAEIFVDLKFRVPCCMVSLPDGTGFYPVDSQGVLLPPDSFVDISPDKAKEFPIVVGIETNPLGSVGDRWGDTAVEGAAQIAALLGPDMKQWGIEKIAVVYEQTNPTEIAIAREPKKTARYKLVSIRGKEINWGIFVYEPQTPGLPGLKETAKKEQIRKWIALYGSFDQIPDSIIFSSPVFATESGLPDSQ